jgi:lipopolysaccharide/colanic/teichoic acid biosynthesis glycosyltransferase
LVIGNYGTFEWCAFEIEKASNVHVLAFWVAFSLPFIVTTNLRNSIVLVADVSVFDIKGNVIFNKTREGHENALR